MKDQLQSTNSPLAVYDLLVEADLTTYHSAMQHTLKVHQVDHLRFVTESDLQEIGMSRPEQRRFLKIYQKHFPDSYIGKLRQKLLSRVTQSQSDVAGQDELMEKGSIASLSSSKTGQHIIPSDSISLCQQLGCGEFASVWQGIWSMSDRSIDKVQVAVKKILPEKMHSNPLDFLQEAAIMHRVDHEHIVRFFGVVLNPKSVMLVTELAPLRSLAECLRQPNFRESLSVVRLCDYAEQVCSGMAYLEENRLIHRDLAARNILVFSLGQVKVADFGLSRALGAGEEYYHSNISVNLKLPIAWCAPECIVYLKFTSASDIWSFGVTLWEMFTYGFQPWAGLTGQQILDCINVPRSRRLDMPDLCPFDYYNLMLQCWEHEPGNRPKFSTLMNLLPEVRPEQVRAVRACEDGQSDHLQYKADTVITVLNKRPREYPDGYYWKGVLNTGRAGLFLPETTISLLNSECPTSINGAILSSSSSSTSDASGRSHHQGRRLRWPAGVNKVLSSKARPKCSKPNRPVISAPGSDLRHTGHIGSDGTYFGDVTFLNCGYRDKLPKLVVAPSESSL
uniref:non-specific protein-tyrosine kinase n=1 Tax=Trichuris muris TaxID=70415 RepID=A0A5S6R1N3_TRIMR